MKAKETRFQVKATMGMVLGKSLFFDKYEEASELASLMCAGQPIGVVEVLNPEGRVCWSYQRSERF